MYRVNVSRKWSIAAIVLAVLNLTVAIPCQLTGGNIIELVWSSYVALFLFQVMMILVLLDFIFTTNGVGMYSRRSAPSISSRDMRALYMFIHAVDPTAFVPSGSIEAPLPWQRIVYFSYSTLTTLEYGDIAPVSPWAQSLVAIESMVGLLYIAIIISRLASVYRRA